MKNEKKNVQGIPVLLIGAMLLGVIMLVYGSVAGEEKSKNSNVSEASGRYDEAEYERALCKKIEELVSSVSGAGEVSVALTLDGSYRAVYAQNYGGSYSENEYILVGAGSSRAPLLLGYSPPVILGVGVVCTGGQDRGVRAEIISLLSAALDLPTNKIYVTAAKK